MSIALLQFAQQRAQCGKNREIMEKKGQQHILSSKVNFKNEFSPLKANVVPNVPNSQTVFFMNKISFMNLSVF